MHKTDEMATGDFQLEHHLSGHSLVCIKLMRQQQISDWKGISVDIHYVHTTAAETLRCAVVPGGNTWNMQVTDVPGLLARCGRY